MKIYNCSPKVGSSIRIPTRDDLLPIIDEIKKSIIGFILSKDELIQKIATGVGNRFNVDILRTEHHYVLPGDMDVNARYDILKDRSRKIPIELVLILNPTDNNYLWDEDQFNIISKRIVDNLIHEIIHMRQSRSRNFLNLYNEELEDTDVLFLSQYDEIDAYSYNIACELTDVDNAYQLLRCPTLVTLQESVNLWAYINVFGKDIHHNVLRRLLKKVYKHYQKIKK